MFLQLCLERMKLRILDVVNGLSKIERPTMARRYVPLYSTYLRCVFWLCSGPRIPSPSEISNVTTSSVLLSWTAASGASYYRVTVEDKEGLVSSMTSNVTSLSVSQLQPGTRYTLSVTVYDSDERPGNTVRRDVFTGNDLLYKLRL